MANETAVAAAEEARTRASATQAASRPARAGIKRNQGRLPEALPRIERVIEPEDKRCPCGCGEMVRIGEDRAHRLDVVPAQYRVLVTIRPRYACPKGRAGVVQAPAPAHLIEGGLPTEALIAHVMVAKFSEHLPLYRQSQVLARHGVTVDRSTLADWVGVAAWHLRPVVDRMAELLKRSTKLYMDETTIACARPRAWQDQDRVSLGDGARRPALGRRRPARRVLPTPPGAAPRMHADGCSDGFRRRPAGRRLPPPTSGSSRDAREGGRPALARPVLGPRHGAS
jgi:transposase